MCDVRTMCVCCIVRQELNDMEQRVRLGGLGGPADENKWDTDLQLAKTIPQFVSTTSMFLPVPAMHLVFSALLPTYYMFAFCLCCWLWLILVVPVCVVA